MVDKEKVIKGLNNIGREIVNTIGHGEAVPYLRTINDALALLKEQDAVKPEREHSGGGTTWWNVCGNCKTAINPNDKFCHECGKKVKWK